MKVAQGYVRVGCEGSNDPQMCLHCERSVCVLDLQSVEKPRGTTQKTPDTKKLEFGKHLRELRMKCGLSTKQLGEMTGRVPSAIISWELGRTYPSMTAMSKLIEIFGGQL